VEINPQMSVQGGYQFGYSARSACGGARFLWSQFWIDYGYAPFGEALVILTVFHWDYTGEAMDASSANANSLTSSLWSFPLDARHSF